MSLARCGRDPESSLERTVSAEPLQSCGLSVTPWAAALQAPLSVGVSRPEPWVGCHALLQGILPNQESNPRLLHLLARSWPLSPSECPSVREWMGKMWCLWVYT